MGKNVAEVIEKQNKTEQPPKIKKSRNGVWFGLVIILIIIGVAGAGYFLLQQLRDKQQDLGGEISKDSQQMMELTKQITGYQDQIVAIQKQLSAVSSNIDHKGENIEQRINNITKVQNERLDNSTAHINDSIQRIQRQLGKTRGDWLLSDAEYLLSIASRRLHLIGDVKTTIEALKAADQRLHESGDTAAFKIRSQIAKDVAAIQQIDIIDIVGLYSSLDMLEEQVSKLTVLLPYSGKPSTLSASTDKPDKNDELIDDKLNNTFLEIEGIVSIKRLDQPVNMIISPQQKFFIQEQLKTKLAIIKITLVQKNEALYKAGVSDTLDWLSENFTKNNAYLHFESELKKLKSLHIRNQFPDISQSLKMLRNIAKLRLETDKALQLDGQSAQ